MPASPTPTVLIHPSALSLSRTILNFSTPTLDPNLVDTTTAPPSIPGNNSYLGPETNDGPEIPLITPDYFKYSFAMWLVKIMLPLALLIQCSGHILVGRLFLSRKSRLRYDSGVFLLNYIAADTMFALYMVVVIAIEVTASLCPVVQILYGVAIVLPMYAVFLITLKRLVRVVRPLQCRRIMTRGREVTAVLVVWGVVVGSALFSLAGWCETEINAEVEFCYYGREGSSRCSWYLGGLVAVDFGIPLLSVLGMYLVMLRESRKAFKKEAFNFIFTGPSRPSTAYRIQSSIVVPSLGGKAPSNSPSTTDLNQVVWAGSDPVIELSAKLRCPYINDVRVRISEQSPHSSPPPEPGSTRRLTATKQASIHGTIAIIVSCFFLRSIPWIPHLLAPDIFDPASQQIAVVEMMVFVQCIGIAGCPFIFLLTTTSRIRQCLYTTLSAIRRCYSGRGKRKVSPTTSLVL